MIETAQAQTIDPNVTCTQCMSPVHELARVCPKCGSYRTTHGSGNGLNRLLIWASTVGFAGGIWIACLINLCLIAQKVVADPGIWNATVTHKDTIFYVVVGLLGGPIVYLMQRAFRWLFKRDKETVWRRR